MIQVSPSQTISFDYRGLGIASGNYGIDCGDQDQTLLDSVVVELYSWALIIVLWFKYYDYRQSNYEEGNPYFWTKDAKIKFEDQENTMIAIHALIVIFAIAEIILAVAMARSSDAGRQSPQENQSYYEYHQMGNEQVPIQMQPFPQQAMVAIPITGANYMSGGIQHPQRM
ncbi:hypothetical protein AWC38_SpisGene15926 [Stylophora pistillata]|uniref:Uncharacterized protein n=1 Tax=Stylophora pistillata TaxID=50429 RepID=A0A2B4RPV1_STYPI|nr:hypothetical protein AWC38_SpisGene15926 [Stylophora pistillata]